MTGRGHTPELAGTAQPPPGPWELPAALVAGEARGSGSDPAGSVCVTRTDAQLLSDQNVTQMSPRLSRTKTEHEGATAQPRVRLSPPESTRRPPPCTGLPPAPAQRSHLSLRPSDPSIAFSAPLVTPTHTQPVSPGVSSSLPAQGSRHASKLSCPSVGQAPPHTPARCRL